MKTNSKIFKLLFALLLFQGMAMAQATLSGLDQKEARIHFIQLHSAPSQSVWQELERQGLQIVGFHGDRRYTAILPTSKLSNADHGIYSLIDQNQWQPAKHLHSLDAHRRPYRDGEQAPLLSIAIRLNDYLIATELESFIQKYRLTEVQSSDRLIIAQIPAAGLEKLFRSPLVNWVDELNYELLPQVEQTRNMHQVEHLQAAAPGGYGLSGKGVVVGVGDSGELSPHIDFSNRILETTDIQTSHIHPEHVAGIIGGGGLLDPRHRGMAPAIKMVVERNYNIILETPRYIETYGMNITNNSYGPSFNCDHDKQLNGLTNSLDEQQRTYPELIHVYAAGNEGHQSCAPYADGYRTILRFFPAAKNVLTVGSIDKDNQIAHNSSQGPTYDGRLKPEVCARGVGVLSTAGENEFQLSSGTSMAAPAVSGVLALLTEFYKNKHNQTMPAGALLKAITCNTADDLGNPGPDFTYGYGRVDALRAVRTLEKEQHQSGQLYEGDQQTFTIEVPAHTKTLKVMLYWPDAETDLDRDHALTNDLDLKLRHSQYGELLPWVLDPAPNAAHLPAQRGIDRLNNIEQITIDQPLAGTYELDVSGHQVPMGAQPFFLVYDFVEEGVELTYPVGGTALTGGEEVLVSWESENTEETTYSLSYSEDGGNSWILIDPMITAPTNTFSWQAPEELEGEVMIQVTHNQSGATDSNPIPFLVLDPVTGFQLDASCDQQLEVECSPHAKAVRYELMLLEEGEMQPFYTSETAKFSFTPNLEPGKDYWMAMRIVTASGVYSERTSALSVQLSAAMPDIQTEVLSDLICFGEENGMAEVSVDNSSAPLSYHWSNGESGPIAEQLGAGLQEVSITSPTGCEWVAEVFIQSPEELSAEIEVTHTTINQADGSIDILPKGGVPPYEYRWSHDASQQGANLQDLASATYDLTITDGNGCQLVEAIVVDFINSNVVPKAGIELKVFPNPTTEFVVAEAELAQDEEIRIRLTDMKGREIQTYDLGKRQSLREVIDLKGLLPGTYLLHLQIGEQSYIRKIIFSQL